MCRKYNLPATFGLPPGFDDCLTHCLCTPFPLCAGCMRIQPRALAYALC